MKYLSTFSGIEAASVAWEPLGWKPVGFSEIEPFPSAVLTHHYPDVKNYGDITKFKEWDLPPFDLLVGGSPCQSFSVAGLRKGLEDPRGNLMLTFLALADKHKPNWIVWENVPGVLSSNDGKDFECFLDGLEEIKYICDVEILDAQNFGVAQRRRRVFVCGQSVDSIRSRKTSSSGLTIIQCLLEISQAILVETLSLYGRGPVKSEQASLSRDGVKRRMRLFDLLTENCAYQTWRNLLVEMFLKSVPVRKNWDLLSGGKTEKELTLEDLLMGSSTESRCTLTEQSLNEALDGVYNLMKLYTTSTLTRETIQPKIYLFFRIEEAIGRLTCRLSGSSPNSSSAMSSFLTFSQELTNYARQASGELFNELEGIHEVFDILKKANAKETALGNIGDWGDSCQVLFDPHCMSGHSAPSREKGKGIAYGADGSIDVSCAGGNISPTVTSKWKTGYGGPSGSNETGNMIFERREYIPDVAQTLSSRDYKGVSCGRDGLVGNPIAVRQPGSYNGQDAYTGRLVSHPIGFDSYNQCLTGDVSISINSAASDINHVGGVLVPHTFKLRGGCDGGGKGYLGQDKCAFTLSTHQDQHSAQPIPINTENMSPASTSWADTFGKEGDPQFTITKGHSHAVAQPITYDMAQVTAPHNKQSRTPGDPCHTLAKGNAGNAAVVQPMTYGIRDDVTPKFHEELSGTLCAQGETQSVMTQYAVRRLTPVEAERLQGFPDNYTAIPWRGKDASQCPDGPRYKALGNSMAVPVMRWIGERIQAVDDMLKELGR